jgi:hypothetical protein
MKTVCLIYDEKSPLSRIHRFELHVVVPLFRSARTMTAVFELPWGLGVEPPSCLLNPRKQDALGYPGGVSFNPPPLMMLSRLCVMTMTMNRQMSTPHLFFYNSNPARQSE